MNAVSALVRWVDGWTGRLSEHPLCYRPLMYYEHQAQSDAAPRLPQQRTGGALVLPSQARQLSAEKLGWNPPEREQFRLLGLGTGQKAGGQRCHGLSLLPGSVTPLGSHASRAGLGTRPAADGSLLIFSEPLLAWDTGTGSGSALSAECAVAGGKVVLSREPLNVAQGEPLRSRVVRSGQGGWTGPRGPGVSQWGGGRGSFELRTTCLACFLALWGGRSELLTDGPWAWERARGEVAPRLP